MILIVAHLYYASSQILTRWKLLMSSRTDVKALQTNTSMHLQVSARTVQHEVTSFVESEQAPASVLDS